MHTSNVSKTIKKEKGRWLNYNMFFIVFNINVIFGFSFSFFAFDYT